jgi:acyl carrier protein
MTYLEQVRTFVIENFLFGDGTSLTDDTPFLQSGIINSTGILELIVFLEKTYGIKVEDAELLPENLDSLRNVAAFLERKVERRTAVTA